MIQSETILNTDYKNHRYPTQYIPNIKIFCIKIVPFVYSYKKQIDSYNKTVHDILTKEIPLILPNFPKNRQEKTEITALLVTVLLDWCMKVYLAIYIAKDKKP